MANLQVQYRGEVQDGIGTHANVISYLLLPDTATLAQTASALGVWTRAVDGCVDGIFTSVGAVILPALPAGLKAGTGATWLASRVQQTGIIDFSATGTSRRYGQALPSFSSAAIVGGQFDLSNAAVQALIALLLNPTGFFTNTQQQVLEAALDALLSFRKHSYLQQRSYVF
jgi:hypothetical protein